MSCGTQKCLHDTCGTYTYGDIITFGHYEQDNNTTNGKEPIEWRIIDKNEAGQYLIVSEKVLAVRPYNTMDISITWEKSTIRSWLNGYGASDNADGYDYTSNNFIDTAFTAEEKARILLSGVSAHPSPKYKTNPGNVTQDKIFLLSIVEANQYFSNDTDRKAMRYSSYFGWWLRSPGNSTNFAAIVNIDGSVYNYGFAVNDGGLGVRPAMWVNLE